MHPSALRSTVFVSLADTDTLRRATRLMRERGGCEAVPHGRPGGELHA